MSNSSRCAVPDERGLGCITQRGADYYRRHTGPNTHPSDRRHAESVSRARAHLRSREPLLRRGLRRAARRGLPAPSPCRATWAARACRWPRWPQQQRRLAYHAPATALAVNMHIYWTGVAADLRRSATPRWSGCCARRPAGEVFAAGHAETGNDLPVLLSTAQAEPAEGGYRISGHKMFGSLTPVWTRLGVHAMDASDPAAPKIVHAFMPRGTPGLHRQRDLGHARHARHAQRRHHSSTALSCPEQYIARDRARPARLTRSSGPSSPGRCSTSAPSTTPSPSAPATWRSPRRARRPRSAVTPVDGLPPRDPAPASRRCSSSSRRWGRTVRQDRRGLVERASTTARRGR